MGSIAGLLGMRIRCPGCARGASPYDNARVGVWEVLGKYNGHPAWKCRHCGTYVQVRPFGMSVISPEAGSRMEQARRTYIDSVLGPSKDVEG